MSNLPEESTPEGESTPVAESTEKAAEKKSENQKATETVKEYTMDEVKKHSTMEDLWVVIHGKIYNATPFLDDHPGGPEILKENAGTDVTEEFEEVYHTPSARKLLVGLYVGNLEGYDPVKAQEELNNKIGAGGSNNLMVAIGVVVLGVVAYGLKTYVGN